MKRITTATIIFLILILIFVVAGCGKKSYVGTWTNGTGSGNVIFERNGKGYITNVYSDADKFSWHMEGSRAILVPDGDPNQTAACDMTEDGHMRVYIPANATEPSQVLTRVKE